MTIYIEFQSCKLIALSQCCLKYENAVRYLASFFVADNPKESSN